MSLAEQLLASPVRKAMRNKDESRAFDDRSDEGIFDARSDKPLQGSMYAGVASEVTEDVKIASVVVGKDTGPRVSSEIPATRPLRPSPMNDLLTELKGKVKSQEARTKSNSSILATDLQPNSEPSHVKLPQEVNKPTEAAARGINLSKAPDVRESRISRRQAHGVAEVESQELDSSAGGMAGTAVTPRSARGEKDTENALLEMEATFKEFDDVMRSLDTEL